jgi:K+-sensing histidine kinase KdpD
MTLVHSQPYCLTQDHLELVQAIADQAGIAVLNARLYAESQQRLIDLEGAHEQYREWQSSLTAMVYHDIRSPLSNIHNSLHLLEYMLTQSEKPAFEPVLA